MEAAIFNEINLAEISYGKPKKQNQGSVVNVFYKRAYLTIQSPAMNTAFGLSEYEGKWSLNLSFNSYGCNKQELDDFQAFLENLKNKIIEDTINKGHYKEWLGVGDKWERFTDEMKFELLNQKIGNDLVKWGKKDLEKKYPPSFTVKIPQNRESKEFKINTFKMSEDEKIEMDAQGQYIEYDPRELLTFDESVKVKPKVFCLFTINIWLVNSNIYISPVCNQILVCPSKTKNLKFTFNPRGFKTFLDSGETEDDNTMNE